MDYASAAAIENSFQIEVANDLARAVRGFPDRVHIINFRQGSVIVDAELRAGLCPDGRNALEILQSLQSQVCDGQSVLKQGKFTRHVLHIRKAFEHGPDSDANSDMDMYDNFMDIPVQIDTESVNQTPRPAPAIWCLVSRPKRSV